jgi:hypothetical protein
LTDYLRSDDVSIESKSVIVETLLDRKAAKLTTEVLPAPARPIGQKIRGAAVKAGTDIAHAAEKAGTDISQFVWSIVKFILVVLGIIIGAVVLLAVILWLDSLLKLLA